MIVSFKIIVENLGIQSIIIKPKQYNIAVFEEDFNIQELERALRKLKQKKVSKTRQCPQ
jgi:serine protease inhibitor